MAMEWFKALAERASGLVSATAVHAHNISDDTPGSLTAEKDANGRSVLRVLLAAVNGLDSLDNWKVNITRREPVVIQTHNAVSVALSGSANSTYLDCRGVDSLAVGVKTDAVHSREAIIDWFADSAGANWIGQESIVPVASSIVGAGRIVVKASYARVILSNKDTAVAHIMSSWTTLLP